ncbi:MAG: hypothetical protein IJH96_02950 [Ruminococcus sp.]|nr:hypothetical protein [Ruminococcus sp.]
MITALSVNIPEKSEGFKRLTNRLRRDKVEVCVSRARGVSLRHITYTSYSGEVRLDRADNLIGAQRSQLLCSEKLVFPLRSGYRRFSSSSFSSRLCSNMALEVLRACPSAAALRCGMFDPHALAADWLLRSLACCINPIVVTDNNEIYSLARERALEELGASITLTKSRTELESCDFLLAPSGIREPLCLHPGVIVLTAGKPSAPIGGEIYYHYNFRMPNGFDTIKPAELSEEYFCSALYTLGAQYELGSIVPLSCSGQYCSQTVKSLAMLLDNRAKKAYNK